MKLARKALGVLSNVVGNDYNDGVISLFNKLIIEGFAERIIEHVLSPTTQYEELKLLFLARYKEEFKKTSVDGDVLFDALLQASEHVALSAFQEPNL
ncbi:hypothetical protein MPL3365_300020 [Mesorhizobium plurifarium]|uniref:Uncharacterized protein n=1 Tax=Mesorhizobium plurifarium TaxID=69974 RepID=A0A090G9S8_MESPL|nr:hypothetical protein MPL3365_300020 [Mesorhizobium plurifarium]